MNRKEMLEEIKRLQAEAKRLDARCEAQNTSLNQLHAEIAHSPSVRLVGELTRQLDLANEGLAMLRFLERIEGFATIRHVPESESDDGYDPDYWVLEGADLTSYSFAGLIKKWMGQADAESE